MQKDVPENANENCPGVKSSNAGKSSSCEGCPNQKKCSSGEAAKEDPAIALIGKKLQNVKNIVLVLSGKGGVGKSTVSSQLALALANAKGKDYQVGLLDIDICGPSIPKMLGLEKQEVHQSNDGWTPVYHQDNLAVMSIGFLLSNQNDAVIWRGPRKNGLIKQFLADVVWDELDYLVIDTPPGTSDEHLSILQYLGKANVLGSIVVTTPQEISLLDVRKELSFCAKTGIPVIGVVENMANFTCPNCKHQTEIFAPHSGGAQKMCLEFGCELISRIPLDIFLVNACDNGKNLYSEESSESSRLREIFRSIVEKVEKFTKK